MAHRFGFETTSEEVVAAFPKSVEGRTFLVTGVSLNGTGEYTALTLARGKPAHLILVGRNPARIQPVVEKIKSLDASIEVMFVKCSLDDQDSVREAAAQINQKFSKIDVVINNAGIMAIPYALSKQGVETQLAANHIGHFLLTNLIVDKIISAGPGSRIVNLSSLGHRFSPFHFDDYNWSNGKTYDRWAAYGQSKTANVLFTVALASRLASKGVAAFAVHPGAIFGTNLTSHLDVASDQSVEVLYKELTEVVDKSGYPQFKDWEKKKSITQGAMTTLVAALDPSLADQSGAWMTDGRVQPVIDPLGDGPVGGFKDGAQYEPAYNFAMDKDSAEKLWVLSEKLVGQRFTV